MTITSFSRGDTWATGYPQGFLYSFSLENEELDKHTPLFHAMRVCPTLTQGFSYSQYTLHPCDSERINGVGSALESFCFHTPHSDAAIIQTTKGGLII